MSLGFKVSVLADSISPDGVRLVSIAYQAPRAILAELNTHRVLSRNAESSRAIPFAKKLAIVTSEPYYPDDLPDGPLMGESPGMQASSPLDSVKKSRGQKLFREAGSVVAKYAKEIADEGFHKENVNRLLEPWSYTRGVITATEMPNFFALRCDYRAYPPFRFLARCIWVALSRSTPTRLDWGQWHLPFITKGDRGEAYERGAELFAANGRAPFGFPDGPNGWEECLLAQWSAARSARVSLYQFGRKVVDWDKDSDLYDKLAGSFPLHASPLEHPALCGKAGSVQRGFPLSNFRAPWVQLRKFIGGENVIEYRPTGEEVAGWNVPDSVFDGDPSGW